MMRVSPLYYTRLLSSDTLLIDSSQQRIHFQYRDERGDVDDVLDAYASDAGEEPGEEAEDEEHELTSSSVPEEAGRSWS